MGRCESEQFCNRFAVGVILSRTFLHNITELRPESLIFLRFILGHFFKHAENLLGAALLHCLGNTVVLQNFTGNIQRQIVGIDQTFNKTQIGRHELLCIIHNEYALNIQFQTVLLFAVVQIPRSLGRNVQQRGIFLLTFNFIVCPGKRFLFTIGIGKTQIEFLVVIILDIFRILGPQCHCTVDLNPFLDPWLRFRITVLILFFRSVLILHILVQFNRYTDMVGIFGDDVLKFIAVEEFGLGILQEQNDIGTAVFLGNLFSGERAVTG